MPHYGILFWFSGLFSHPVYMYSEYICGEAQKLWISQLDLFRYTDVYEQDVWKYQTCL